MTWGRTPEQQKWVDEANAAEEARARCKRETKLEGRARDDLLRAELQREIATLRAEMTQQSNLMLEAAGQALGDISNKILDRVEAAVNKLEGDLRRQFGEAMGRLDAIAPDARSRSKDFKFAGERDADSDPVDLPNPLRRVN
jgi:regulator of protease activity HflC (stomatin/prohibitin superfamily)